MEISEIVANVIPGFNEFCDKKKNHLINDIVRIVKGKREHKNNVINGLDGAFFIQIKIAKKKYGRNYKYYLDLFSYNGNNNYHFKKDNYEKGYCKERFLKDEIKIALRDVTTKKLRVCDRKIIKNENGREIKKYHKRTVRFKDKNNNVKSSKIQLGENFIRINLELGVEYSELLRRWYLDNEVEAYNKHTKPTTPIKKVNEIIGVNVDLCNLVTSSQNRNFDKPGFTIQYKESRSGRLYSTGENSLQNTIRFTRKVLTSNLNYYDYDLDNCHYRILLQRMKEIGTAESFSCIEYYIENKKECRGALRTLGITENEVKRIYISNIYGACYSKRTLENNKIVSVEKIEKLFKYPFFIGLRKETIKAGKIFINHAEKSKNKKYYMNIMRKSLETKCEKNKILSHLILGYEALFLQTVMKKYGSKAMLLMFDGWLGYKVNKRIAENLILNETGYIMKISEEEIKIDLNSLKG